MTVVQAGTTTYSVSVEATTRSGLDAVRGVDLRRGITLFRGRGLRSRDMRAEKDGCPLFLTLCQTSVLCRPSDARVVVFFL